LVSKTAFLRPIFWRYYDKPTYKKSALLQKKTNRTTIFNESEFFNNFALKKFISKQKYVNTVIFFHCDFYWKLFKNWTLIK
jgi:hypothetical protein